MYTIPDFCTDPDVVSSVLGNTLTLCNTVISNMFQSLTVFPINVRSTRETTEKKHLFVACFNLPTFLRFDLLRRLFPMNLVPPIPIDSRPFPHWNSIFRFEKHHVQTHLYKYHIYGWLINVYSNIFPLYSHMISPGNGVYPSKGLFYRGGMMINHGFLVA